MATDIRKTLLLEIHRIIANTAKHTVDELDAGITGESMTYPPKPMLSKPEVDALCALQLTTDLQSGLQKLIADSCASAFFLFFSLIDGVADPEVRDVGLWLGARIVEPPDDEDAPMWHDDLYESYWQYEELTDGDGVE